MPPTPTDSGALNGDKFRLNAKRLPVGGLGAWAGRGRALPGKGNRPELGSLGLL